MIVIFLFFGGALQKKQKTKKETQISGLFIFFLVAPEHRQGEDANVYDEADIVVAASLVFGGGVSAADTVDHTRHGSARVCAVAT
ncbi:integrin alpha 3 [Sarotherodon galilaeus]